MSKTYYAQARELAIAFVRRHTLDHNSPIKEQGECIRRALYALLSARFPGWLLQIIVRYDLDYDDTREVAWFYVKDATVALDITEVCSTALARPRAKPEWDEWPLGVAP